VAADIEESRRERQGRSVEHLQGLYAVVVAIALSLAIDRLIAASGAGVHYRWFLMFVALLATVVPFYHGALRHLDEQYAFGAARGTKRASVLFDFWLLFLVSCAFLALAVSLSRPRVFTFAFLALIAFDIIWTYVAQEFLAGGADLASQEAWQRINWVAACILVVFSVATGVHTGYTHLLWYGVPVLAIGRTLADYRGTWRFYAAVDE
jgi:hypothetical protein